MKNKSYSDSKSQFVQERMNDGRSNRQANSDWSKSSEKESFEQKAWESHSEKDGVNTPNGDEWDDYAHTADDL